MKRIFCKWHRLMSLVGILAISMNGLLAFAQDDIEPTPPSKENPAIMTFGVDYIYPDWVWDWMDANVSMFGDLPFQEPTTWQVRSFYLDDDPDIPAMTALNEFEPYTDLLYAPGAYKLLMWSNLDPEAQHAIVVDEANPANPYAYVAHNHTANQIAPQPEAMAALYPDEYGNEFYVSDDPWDFDWFDEDGCHKYLGFEATPIVKVYPIKITLKQNRKTVNNGGDNGGNNGDLPIPPMPSPASGKQNAHGGIVVPTFTYTNIYTSLYGKAVVTGMAPGINIATGELGTTPVSHELDLTFVSEDPITGNGDDYLVGYLTTFGHCEGEKVELSLALLLSQDENLVITTTPLTIDITSQIDANPDGGEINATICVLEDFMPQYIYVGDCNDGLGAAASDPSLPFSINIERDKDYATLGANDYNVKATNIYTKSIDFKDMEEPYNVSWKVTRYSGVLGDPLSDNPADWVPISTNGVDCTKAPYLAVVERGTNLDFSLDRFQRPFFDIDPTQLETSYFEGIQMLNDLNTKGLPCHLMDYDPDNVYDNYFTIGGPVPSGCYFYALEVNVNGQSAIARTEINTSNNQWAGHNKFNPHTAVHILQVFDKQYVEDLGASTVNPDDNIEYEALAFDEEARKFYYINYSDADNAVKVEASNTDDLMVGIFGVGPVLTRKFMVYYENFDDPTSPVISIPSTITPGMRTVTTLKYWNLDVRVGTKTKIGLFVDVFDAMEQRRVTELDFYAWGNACDLIFGIPEGRGDDSSQIIAFRLRPYLPQARLTDVEFYTTDLGDTETLVSENLIDGNDTPTEYNNVKHYLLTAKVSGVIPYTPQAVEMPNISADPINILTKIQGLEVTLGNRTYEIDLDKAHLSEDGSFEAYISGLDPKEILKNSNSATVDAYVSNTKWYTWSPMVAFSNFNNEWNVFSPSTPKLQVPLEIQLNAPDFDVEVEEQWTRGQSTKTLHLKSIAINQAASSLNGNLYENLILSVGEKGSAERHIIEFDENQFHAHNFFDELTDLDITLDEIAYDKTWPVQEFRLAHAYFFDVNEIVVEGGENTVITGVAITDPDSQTRHRGRFGNKASDVDNRPALSPENNQTDADITRNHSGYLSLVAKREISISDTTGVEDIVAGDNAYSINGRQVTINADNVSIYTTAGAMVADGLGTYTLQPGIYLIGGNAKTDKVAIQ